MEELSMQQLRFLSLGYVLLGVLILLGGCGKSEAPSLAISGTSPSSDSLRERLHGTWLGKFVMHPDADKEAFDEATVEACKSMQLRITFRPDGTMTMAARMTLPELGTQSQETTGKWSFVSQQQDTLIIRSEEEGGEAEEVSLHFRSRDVFEMLPPNQLQKLGLMRFERQVE
jgi:hypothetical protein